MAKWIKYPEWVIRKLGKTEDREIAREMRLNVSTISQLRRRMGIPSHKAKAARWDLRMRKKLGTVPDIQIAQELKISISAVAQYRRSLGIPAFSPHDYARWTEEQKAKLGTASDAEVAAALRKKKKRVKNFRLRQKIRPVLQVKMVDILNSEIEASGNNQ